MSSDTPFTPPALAFVQALARRDYASAHRMLTSTLQQGLSPAALQSAFEDMIPLDWGSTDPIEVGTTMTEWPGKQPGELGWVYVSIAGDMYSEAVTVVVVEEDAVRKISSVEWGRP